MSGARGPREKESRGACLPAALGRRTRRPRGRPFRRLARGDGSPADDGPGASAARNADRTRDTGSAAGLPRRPRAPERFASAFGRSRRARACDGPPRRGLRRRASGRFARDAAARSPVSQTSLTASSLAVPLTLPEHATAGTASGATTRPSGCGEHCARVSTRRLAASAPTLGAALRPPPLLARSKTSQRREGDQAGTPKSSLSARPPTRGGAVGSCAVSDGAEKLIHRSLTTRLAPRVVCARSSLPTRASLTVSYLADE